MNGAAAPSPRAAQRDAGSAFPWFCAPMVCGSTRLREEDFLVIPMNLLAVFLLGLLAAGSLARGAELTPAVATLPATVRRVVVLGDSITYAGGYVNAIATYFATRQPGRAIEFLNVGLPSETVSGLSEEGHAGGKFPRPDLHERLGRVLAQSKPDLVIACYGMNDGIYQPWSEERFAKFKSGMVRLHDTAVKAGAKILHVTPPTYEDARGGKAGYAAVLDRYSEWLVQQRGAAKWDVADVHTPMQRHLDEQWRRDPAYFISKDGVHAGEAGHWIMAREILRHLGARDLDGVAGPQEMAARHPRGAEIAKLVGQRHALMRDAWLSATGHTRPGMKAGLPLAEAQARATELDRRIAARP